MMPRLLLIFLMSLGLSMCTSTLPPTSFQINGVWYGLPAEKNVPEELDAGPGIEVVVVPVTWEELQKVECGAAKVAGCSLKIDKLCIVWTLKDGILPEDVAKRVYRHERGGHCNGHNHEVYTNENGTVLDWIK